MTEGRNPIGQARAAVAVRKRRLSGCVPREADAWLTSSTNLNV
jgi:hypothetical protein